jgi:uncharacterized protein with von Willebrand factor type A (vWA) domain
VKIVRYSAWDGSQAEWKLDAEEALDALTDLMMQGLNAEEAMQYMRNYGFDLAGQDFRVMGAQELMQELRKQARQLASKYNLNEATKVPRERLEELLGWEEDTVKEEHGFESRKLNDFLDRRHTPSKSLSEAIDRFSDYEFENEDAAEAYQELKQEQDNLRELEKFLERYKSSFRGRTPADYETAQKIREQMQGIEQMMGALQNGKFEQVDPKALGEMLGENAARSMVMLRNLDSTLRDRGFLRNRAGHDELTPAAVRRIGAQALASIYTSLRKGRQGNHDTTATGVATPRPDETRPFRHGDSLDIDVVKSVLNGARREARERAGDASSRARFKLSVEDLEVRQMDFMTQSTTVLLLDLSWSMSFENRFPAAKRVALAMHQLIRTRFPRDHFSIVGFSTRARELRVQDLPEVTSDPSDPFTNLQEGLMLAERLIAKHPSPSSQILVITDGQPTAYFVDDELHVEWPSGYGGISPRAVAQTLKQVQRVTQRGITITTFMLHDSPQLVGFVERLTEINRGRAVFTNPSNLGSYVMVDHLANRRRRSR